jgi:hypothetical protein
VVVNGPITFDFYNSFATQKATMLKANGKDIISVNFVVRAKGEEKPI